jgi:hypothetical protein
MRFPLPTSIVPRRSLSLTLFFAPNLVSHTKLTPTPHQITYLSRRIRIRVAFAILRRYLSRDPETPRTANAACQFHIDVAPPGRCTYMTPVGTSEAVSPHD